jgi:hypothetical protein
MPLDYADGVGGRESRLSLGSLDTPSPLDRCMVLACGEVWTDDTHGWRTCTTHAPRVVVLSS